MADVQFYFVNGLSNLTINSTSNYMLLGYEGIEAPDIDFYGSNNALGDGGFMQAARVPMRRMTVDFVIDYGASQETYRATAISFFKPGVLYTISVTRNSITRNIDGYLLAKPVYRQDNINLPIFVTLELICPTPYFRATSMTTVNETSANVSAFTNPGDVPCGFLATITATGGAVVDPTVGNADGDTMELDQDMASTDIVVFSTTPGNCYVTYEGTEVYTYTDESVFFLLEPGSNTITYGATSGTSYIVGKIEYYPLYLGV